MEIAEQIIEKAEFYRDTTAQNLSEIVKIPSLSGKEEAVIQKIASLLEDAEFDDVRVDGLGNLIGRVGNGPTKLVFDAHVDVVDTGDASQWEQDPFSGEIKDGKVLGRGAADQKGGAAAMITAGKILKELGYDKDFSIFFTFTVMEEDCEGLCWKYIIEEEGLIPDFVVLTEPTGLTVTRGQRGRMEMDLIFKGVSAHGSAPERGENAVYKASRAALEIEKLHNKLKKDPFLGKGSIAVTQMISDSPSLCAVPDQCRFHLDRRLTWGETKESVLQEIGDAVSGNPTVDVPHPQRLSYKGVNYSREQYFPTWKIPKDHPLVIAGVKTYEHLKGKPPKVGKWVFSTNGVVTCGEYGIPAIGFGPGHEVQAHAPNEWIPIDHLVTAAAFSALLPYIL